MKHEREKSNNNIGLHIIFITLLVAVAVLISEDYRIWIILASPAIFTIWTLWLWSAKLEEFQIQIKRLEDEKESDEKILNTIKNISIILNNLKVKK